MNQTHDQTTSSMNQNNSINETTDDNKYIIFKLGQELYGAKLLEVREVVEELPTKQVPNTVPAFRGVCNLRGQIIGVVDLKTRFNLETQKPDRPIFLVFDTESGGIATCVDQIASVSVIPNSDVESKVNIVSTIPSKYIIGIGKLNDRMVTLIDLKSVLSNDELSYINHSKLQESAS